MFKLNKCSIIILACINNINIYMLGVKGKMNDKIVIKGAKEHNLKNISLEIPRDKLVVITGLSGSR